jgi:peptide-methionine (R)-S-oxide reductase
MKDGEIKNKLSPAQVSVMLHRVTEPPYFGKFWDHFEAGTYRCAACDTALFSSDEKFDSRTGWPSFKKPIHERDLQFKSEAGPDDKVELRCKKCKGHLGYVISGETPYYRINSVCLQFEPRPVPPPTPAVAAVEEKPAAEKKTIIAAPAMLEIEPVEVGTSWSTSSLIVTLLVGLIAGALGMQLYMSKSMPGPSGEHATSTLEAATSTIESDPAPRVEQEPVSKQREEQAPEPVSEEPAPETAATSTQ